MGNANIRTLSGKDLKALTMENVLCDAVSTEDFRISSETLRSQADAAESAGYRHLAMNLRRAAELTGVSNAEVFQIYNTLRPGRATYTELMDTADRLEKELHAPLTATLVREAAAVYRARGLFRS